MSDRAAAFSYRSGRSAGQNSSAGPSHGRHQNRTVRVALATTTSSWLCPVCSSVTTPWPGRDDESRFSSTTVDEYSVSPWNSGCGNRTSVKPRFATIVPCVSCATELPDQHGQRHHRVHQPLPERLPGRPRGVQVQGLRVHGERREQDVVRLGHRAPGPVQVPDVQLELLVVQPALLDVSRHRDAPVKPSSRAITISCTCVVPSPISRIFESR